MATTAGSIITAAFIKIGIESPTAAQTAAALISFNNMLSMWGAEDLNYVVVAENFTLTAADPTYTIGSGGDFNTVRPMRINTCFLRNPDGYDFPVGVMSSQEYATLHNKTIEQRPSSVYLLPEYPLAKIHFNAAPDAAYDAYFEFVKNFTEFTATTTAFNLPPEYKEALVYNLALSLGADWNRPVSQYVYARAEETKTLIGRINASMRTVPSARFDMATGGAGYDIATDSLVDGGTV